MEKLKSMLFFSLAGIVHRQCKTGSPHITFLRDGLTIPAFPLLMPLMLQGKPMKSLSLHTSELVQRDGVRLCPGSKWLFLAMALSAFTEEDTDSTKQAHLPPCYRVPYLRHLSGNLDRDEARCVLGQRWPLACMAERYSLAGWQLVFLHRALGNKTRRWQSPLKEGREGNMN